MASRQTVRYMQIVASLTDPAQAAAAQAQGADIIELRFDLADSDPVETGTAVQKSMSAAGHCHASALHRKAAGISGARGVGRKDRAGHPARGLCRCRAAVCPARPAGKSGGKNDHRLAPFCADDAIARPICARAGTPVYGDIPKIIVTPKNEDDLIDLIRIYPCGKKTDLHRGHGGIVPVRPGDPPALWLGVGCTAIPACRPLKGRTRSKSSWR